MAGSLTSIEPRGCIRGSQAADAVDATASSLHAHWFRRSLVARSYYAIKGLPETIRFVGVLRLDPVLRLTRNGATPKMEVPFVSDTQARACPFGADLQFAQNRRCPRSTICQNQVPESASVAHSR